MKSPSFDNYSDLKEFIYNSSLEEFKEILSNLSPKQQALAFKILGEAKEKSLDSKIELLFSPFQDTSSLEQMAGYLDSSGWRMFLHFLHHHPHQSPTLFFVLKGLPFEVFYDKIGELEEEEMRLMKLETSLEPLSFHLSLFASKLKEAKEQMSFAIEQLVHLFYTQNFETLTVEKLHFYFSQIEELDRMNSIYLHKLNQGLLLVWNTLRVDLIEELSRLKEFFLKVKNRIEEKEELHFYGPEHLKTLLKEAYKNVYQLFNENLDAPSLEGLACLSLWNVKDYIEVGLLPFFSHLEEYEHYLESASEKEKARYQENLLNYVQNHLTSKGLRTIKDLEENYIFSKELLLNYLKNQDASEESRIPSI